MFTRIQARSFRCLRSIDQSLGQFSALVGPNASGKTTFLDTIGMLSDLMRHRGDVRETVDARSANFEKLLWMGEGTSFQIAVEANIPTEVCKNLSDDKQNFRKVRYEIEIGLHLESNEIGLNHETLWLKEAKSTARPTTRDMFPELQPDRGSLITRSQSGQRGQRVALTKMPGGNDNYYTEGRKSYKPSFKLGRGKSALANIPADTESFPVSTWFRELLEKGVQPFVLNSQLMRQPSPPGLGRRFQTDGSNLPWVVAALRRDQKRFRAWLDHVRTALEDIKDVTSVERPGQGVSRILCF